ncbi:PIG-L deacetylase family protein [Kitasatospora sp. NBC_01302]|uniref:PIG-L deacetylase family protein n=1 Tax=Kitasatospora sp. NBC_01302 TaxID=2903575 RepID=UPI002E131F71|nr:PIG-L family deacetylase [Kitasatospora sp. NBC_01302]
MTEAPPSPLAAIDENWQRALAVVAHPDDMEYGAAAAVARWTAQGRTVVYAMVTSGEAGIDSLDPARCAPLREAEQIASAELVGVDTVEFLRHPDGVVEYGLPLRRDIARLVRRHRPEIVLTTNFRETYGGVFPNQADHVATGRAALDAARDAGNRWVFRELTAEGLEPWNGVRQVWAAGSPLSGHGVDTTDHFEAGVASLEAHAAYLAGLGGQMSDARGFLESMGRATGTRLGTRFAAAFEVINLHPQ